MSEATIHGEKPVYTASNARECVARALSEIKQKYGYTYGELGVILGKSEDQAAKYCDGSAEIGLVSYGRACREWGPEFSGYLDRLCAESRHANLSDRSTLTILLDAATVVSKALEDGVVSPAEVKRHRSELEKASDALAALLGKLRVVA